MAKAHVYLAPGANVETTDTFASWIDTTNQLVFDMGTVVLTSVAAAQPNTTIGGYTAGNSHLQGILSANTLVATQSLRGGTVSTPANLTVSSNVIFNTSELIRVDANTNNFTINANNMNITSNVAINEATKTVTITAANTTINAGVFYVRSNTELTGTRVDVDGNTFDVTSNTIFTSSRLNANVDIITLGFNGSDTLNVNSISNFNANVNIDGVFTVTANAVFTGANTTVAVLEATGEIRLKGASKTLKVQGTTTAQPSLNISLANTSVTVTPMVVNSTSILPGANNTYNLGENLMRWDKTWTKDLDVANTISVHADIDVDRDVIVRRDLYVYGNTSFASDVSLAIDASDIQDLNVLGTLSMASSARVDTNFIPANNALYNLGSTTSGWNALYANTIVANTISGALSGNATTATTLQTARTINGISFNGSNNITIPAITDNLLIRGTYLTGNNFNGSANTTWAVDATNLATASKVVARDASGNFSANTITAALAGNANTASALRTAVTINGISFNGANNITIPAVTGGFITNGTYITGDTFNGSANTTWSIDATDSATALKIVVRDAAGSFAANTITATTITATTVTGNGSGLTTLNGSNISSGTVADARIATTLVRTSRTVSPGVGGGLSGGGDLSANRTLSVDSTVVRTTGDQTLGGVKTFSNGMIGNVTGSITGNANTATTFLSNRTNYITATNTAVAGELMWKHFGDNHTVFDASNSTSPSGVAVSNITAATAWIPTYPTLMGWNGVTTYGVRVDSARIANTVTNGVYTTGNQTIDGTKTFSSTIVGSITGNANTATSATSATNATNAANVPWTGVGSKPTTISGYGITDAVSDTAAQTVGGAKTLTGKLTVSLNTSTPIYSTGHLELQSPNASSVSIGFHRIGSTACQLRHDSDGLILSGTDRTTQASFVATGNVSAYSDARLKTNVRTIDNALDKVSNMRGVFFDKAGEASVGVIAQEMEKVLPEVVFDGDYKSVAYGNIVGVLIEAIKELKAEIEELKKGR